MDGTGRDSHRTTPGSRRAALILAAALPILAWIAAPGPAKAQFGFGFGGGGLSVGGAGRRGMREAPRGERMPGGYGGQRGPGGYGTGSRHPSGGVRVPGGYGDAGPTGRPPRYPPGRPGYPYPRPYPGRPGPWIGGGYPPPMGYPPPYRPPVVVEDPGEPPPARTRRRAAPPPRAVAAPAAPPPARRAPARQAPAPRPPAVAAVERSFVDREVLVETAGTLDDAAITRMAARHGLTRLASQPLLLTGSTVHRFRVNGRRGVDQAVAALGADAQVLSAQRNHIYRLTQRETGTASSPSAPTYALAPSQYAAAKLHLSEAHRLATGEGILVAVIDSGVDTAHPELRGAIGGNENTLSSQARPDLHGTGIAGIIAARSQLMGVAPGTRLLAIRAFAPASGRTRAEGTSYDIIRAVDLAAKAGARIVNMSFAGPADRLMARELAGGIQRGMIFVAAAGNGGASAPAAYPAAEPGVIAVTATDPEDRLYGSANRGPYVAMAAPGVDVLVATPGGAYGVTSGTSVAAAHVSGIVALMLQREGGLTPAAVRERLAAEATDLGPTGPDPEFGAGLVDAYAALGGKAAPPAPPVATAPPAAPVASAAPAAPVVQGAPPPPPAGVPVVAADPASTRPVAPPVAGTPPPPPPEAPAADTPPPGPVASADPAAPAAAPVAPAAPVGTPPPPLPEPLPAASPAAQGTPPPPPAEEPKPIASAAPSAPPAPTASPPPPPPETVPPNQGTPPPEPSKP